ncbi:prolyl oligopeptidase family serine peptidase [Rheinheimera sp. MMS21-TC3]|uniref:prolyl oligopeptidase family serine peptidase n=1 Tax=Rheinheimera sp. MMS21-TC3 TaxID=3072790 RepID=UPI0028C47E3A|nr:prolyl oligopeptidase family serine peptidase [Rheinheimera sp. MMS21-TC3]WNO62034.1 prolyl oligopeptidase family serine peptidase [Rheinheimera sp. MMS21-TC3]
MKYALSILAVSLITACSSADNINPTLSQTTATMPNTTTAIHYPTTAKGAVVDSYFGQKVADPYRWLEDDRSAETEAWVKAQNKVTFNYLDGIAYRDTIKQKLTESWNYEKVGAPFKEGNYTYYYKNDGLQNQYVLYRLLEDGSSEVFLDPNSFSSDGTTSLAGVTFSKDGSKAAYAISEGGSDWRKVIIIDAETKQQLEPVLVDIKFSGISWVGNEGFYYSSYDKPDGSELSAKTDQHKLYYHQLGTSQQQDKVVFGAKADQKHRYVGATVTDDARYLLISAAVSTSGNKLFVKDLTKPNSELVTILDHTNSDTNLLDSQGSTLFLVTNLNAPNKKVVKVDVSNPTAEHWQDVIPHTEHVLSANIGAGYIFANYMVDALSKVQQYDYNGKLVRDIQLPNLGTVSGFGGKKQDDTLYYSFSNYTTAPTIYSFAPSSGESEVYYQSAAKFDSQQYVSEQVFYTSKDGTKVPMMINYKKGLKLDGSNPTILYGYGGFNVSLTPGFSVSNAVWMELGGIYAVPNLRGGGEYGKAWHKAGTLMQKQNVFDDFIAAAKYLQNKGYTSAEKLAIRGGSNGGLLVGAVMTQQPELVKVALPAVGVMDMLRYHTFTAGAGWAYDYGTSEQSSEMFKYLLGYSPVHNVQQGVAYPATLVTTADHDDRVVPAHSFKFAAELQAKAGGINPQLIRIETNAGHGAGTPVSKQIEQTADIFSFTLYNMGYQTLPK